MKHFFLSFLGKHHALLLAGLFLIVFGFLYGSSLAPSFRYNTANTLGPRLSTPYKEALTTVFWVGESASTTNGYIANSKSAWDENWKAHYGGFDDPDNRCGFIPCDFNPEQNSFYAALPYSDWHDNGEQKANAKKIVWFKSGIRYGTSIIKNQWIEVRRPGRVCYGQIEDVGPFEEDDFAYVFGANPHPKNTEGLGAGLDVSPALRDCLGFWGSAKTWWRFVPENSVPDGPWKRVVTENNYAP